MESRRHRSPAYPSSNVKEAIDRTVLFFKKEGKHKATVTTAVGHWGYSPASSAGSAAIAAQKTYGLMEDSGEGTARKVNITPLGLAIVQDERVVSPERDAAIRQAVLLPKIMADLWTRYGTDLPSDDTLGHYLKVEREFNPNAVKDVIRIYKDNVAFAGLNRTADDVDESDEDPATEEPLSPPAATVPAGRPAASAATPASVQSLPFAGEIANIRVSRDCTIRLIATGDYSRKSIEALIAQLQLGLQLGTYDDPDTPKDDNS